MHSETDSASKESPRLGEASLLDVGGNRQFQLLRERAQRDSHGAIIL